MLRDLRERALEVIGGDVVGEGVQSVETRVDGDGGNRLPIGTCIGGGGDQGGGAGARAHAEDFLRIVRMSFARPSDGGENVALLQRSEAGELPAACAVPAKIERQH